LKGTTTKVNIPTTSENLAELERLLRTETGWQRHGDCTHCGHCCNFEGPQRQTFEASENPARFDSRYFKVRGYEVEDDRRASIITHAFVPCPKFDRTATGGAGACTIYQERPATCRKFPEFPLQVLQTPCTYWFENRINGHVFRFGGNGSQYPGLHIEQDEPQLTLGLK